MGTGSQALACLPPPTPLIWFDRGVKVAADCSFERAGENHYSDVLGDAAVDLGNGFVSQVYKNRHFCGTDSSIAVVDCNNERSVLIEGAPHPDDPVDWGGGPIHSVDWVIDENGPVQLTSVSSLDEVTAVAEQASLTVAKDASVFFENLKRRNRYDPLCGCELFYPELSQ